MVYVGIDPSFTKTGVCYVDTDEKTVTFNAISPPGTNTNYKKSLDRSGHIVVTLIKELDMKKDTYAVLEEPLMSTYKASRLGILSGIVSWTLAFMPNIKKIYSITPTYIARTNKELAKREGLKKKQASQHVALGMLDILQKEGWTFKILNDKYLKDGTMKQRKLSHDEAEAFILTLKLLEKMKALDASLLDKLLTVNTGLTLPVTLNLIKGEFK